MNILFRPFSQTTTDTY